MWEWRATKDDAMGIVTSSTQMFRMQGASAGHISECTITSEHQGVRKKRGKIWNKIEMKE